MSSFNFNSSTYGCSPSYNTPAFGESSNGILQLHENLSYGMITPHYSPDTTVAITLRHFEKEAKSQAEREYDDENGTLPPPPAEDDPTVDPDTRKAHKKKRKVRSAIVSRRKTAIYLEKLETELETRDSMNTTLAKNLELYREVIADVRAKIDAMQHSLSKHSSMHNNNNNNKRMRSSYTTHLQTSNNSGRIRKPRRSQQTYQQHFQQEQPQQTAYFRQPMNNVPFQRQYQQHSAQSFQSPNPVPEIIRSDPITPPPSFPQQTANTEYYMNQQSSSNSEHSNAVTESELDSTISAEEIGELSQHQHQEPLLQQPTKQYQYQALNYKQASEADFSECSDTVEWPQQKAVPVLDDRSFPLSF